MKLTRKIVKIDEDKCDGCGACVPSCAEGAIEIIDGKAKLAAENLCDGLGNCLGVCPKDAITIEEREADEFDEALVAAGAHGRAENPEPAGQAPSGQAPTGQGSSGQAGGEEQAAAPRADGSPQRNKLGRSRPAAVPGGCPGAMMRKLRGAAGGDQGSSPPAAAAPTRSRLTHWPIQLALLPVHGEIWRDADVLIAADCVGFAMPDFHERLLAGKTPAVACPKLDDAEGYVAKLAVIFAGNRIRSVTVAHMEVPCCSRLVDVVIEALDRSGKYIPLRVVEVELTGIVSEEVPQARRA